MSDVLTLKPFKMMEECQLYSQNVHQTTDWVVQMTEYIYLAEPTWSTKGKFDDCWNAIGYEYGWKGRFHEFEYFSWHLLLMLSMMCLSVWISSLEDIWMDYIEKHYSLFNLLAIDNNKTGLLGFVYKPFNHQTTVQKKGTSQSKAWTDCVQSNFLQFFVFKKKFFFWSFMLKRSFLKAKQKKKTQ